MEVLKVLLELDESGSECLKVMGELIDEDGNLLYEEGFEGSVQGWVPPVENMAKDVELDKMMVMVIEERKRVEMLQQENQHLEDKSQSLISTLDRVNRENAKERGDKDKALYRMDNLAHELDMSHKALEEASKKAVQAKQELDEARTELSFVEAQKTELINVMRNTNTDTEEAHELLTSIARIAVRDTKAYYENQIVITEAKEVQARINTEADETHDRKNLKEKEYYYMLMFLKRSTTPRLAPSRFSGSFVTYVAIEGSYLVHELPSQWGFTYKDLRRKINNSKTLSLLRNKFVFSRAAREEQEVRYPFVPLKGDTSMIMNKLSNSYGLHMQATTDINDDQWAQRKRGPKPYGFTIPFLTIRIPEEELHPWDGTDEAPPNFVPFECDNLGCTPLHYAADEGDAVRVQALLEAGCSPLQRDSLGRTPAHIAAERGHKEVLRLFLPLRLHRRVDTKGRTLLHVASIHEHDVCASLLLEIGSDPNASDFHGMTALHCAVASASKRCIALLLHWGAVVDPLSGAEASCLRRYRSGGKKLLWSWSLEPVMQIVCGLPDPSAASILRVLGTCDVNVPFSYLKGNMCDAVEPSTASFQRTPTGGRIIGRRNAVISAAQQHKAQLLQELIKRQAAIDIHLNGWVGWDILDGTHLIEAVAYSGWAEGIRILSNGLEKSVMGQVSILSHSLYSGDEATVAACIRYDRFNGWTSVGPFQAPHTTIADVITLDHEDIMIGILNETTNDVCVNLCQGRSFAVTPLWLACYCGLSHLVQVLLSEGACPDIGIMRTEYVKGKSPKEIEKLADCYGAGLMGQNIDGIPLILKGRELYEGRVECFKQLLCHTRTFTTSMRRFITQRGQLLEEVPILPMMLAASTGDVEIIKMCLRKCTPELFSIMMRRSDLVVACCKSVKSSSPWIESAMFASQLDGFNTQECSDNLFKAYVQRSSQGSLRYLLQRFKVDPVLVLPALLRSGNVRGLSAVLGVSLSDSVKNAMRSPPVLHALAAYPADYACDSVIFLVSLVTDICCRKLMVRNKQETLATLSAGNKSVTTLLVVNRFPDLLNEVNADGMTPLHLACATGKLDIVLALLELGASLSAKDSTPCCSSADPISFKVGRRAKRCPEVKASLNLCRQQWSRNCSLGSFSPFQYLTTLSKLKLQQCLGKGNIVGSQILSGVFSDFAFAFSFSVGDRLFNQASSQRVPQWIGCSEELQVNLEKSGILDAHLTMLASPQEDVVFRDRGTEEMLALYSSKTRRPNKAFLTLLVRDGTLMEKLDLSEKYVGGDSIRILLRDLLPCLSRLESLDLRSCQMGNQEVALLYHSALRHPSLTTIDLSSNPNIFLEGAAKLRRLKELNLKIMDVRLSNTGVSLSMRKAIEQAGRPVVPIPV